jgi:ubiquinone/menaquinone biosynthesis C-methylase UbiE
MSRVFTDHCASAFCVLRKRLSIVMPLRAHAAQVEPKAPDLLLYRNPDVVSHYASLGYLTDCERHLFDTYLTPGMAVLDLGVGGGRTTPYLFPKASRYVGVDYSEEMIRLCRDKFPQLEFLVADASDLSKLSGGSFDAIVFSFNGMDCLFPEEQRWQCLQECRRLLRAGGVFIFSSHNPRSVLVRSAWDRERLRVLAGKLVSERSALYPATLGTLTVAKALHSFLRATVKSVGRICRRLPKAAFWRGEGYVFDPAHGGSTTHCWTPTRVREELSRFNFRQQDLLGDDHPRRSHELVTDWYYYVFIKAEGTAGESCA